MIGLITNILFRYFWLFIPGLILQIFGIWIDWCSKAGLALLVADVIVSFIEQMRIRKAMLSDSDNEQFRKFQDAVSKEGNVFENVRRFVEDASGNPEGTEDARINNFIIATLEAICEKCKYGEAMEMLNEHERVFYVTQILEQEVNNGGFSQFFFNSSGDLSNELVDAFTKIGALKTAKICKKALAVFNGKVPTDRDEREELLDSLDCDDVLSECDDEFYEYEDSLDELNYAYVMKHRNSFE